MYAADADRIPSTDKDASDALRRLVFRSRRRLGAALLGGAVEAGPAVGGRRAAAVGPRWLWRGIVVALCLGLALVALAAPAWAAKDDIDLVSRAAGATGTFGNGGSDESAISADGRYVAFTSRASNLHPDDTDTRSDVFVRELQTNTVTLVSRASGAAGAKGNARSFGPAISADGRFVAFVSSASNLHPDDDANPDTFLNQDVFVRDLQANTTTLVSRAAGATGAKGNSYSNAAAISADGRFVAFSSTAWNLHPGDDDSNSDVFARDLQTNTVTLVSRAGGAAGAKGNARSSSPAISTDGRFVAFDSDATNLHPDDGDTSDDVFVRDLQANTTTLVSRAAGATGDKGDGDSEYAAISADGRFVAFDSDATNLHPDDDDSNYHVFVRDLETNTTTLVSRATGADGAKGDAEGFNPAISADGRFVAFESDATNLHPGDGDSDYDVFVRDLEAHTTTLVSRAAGATGENGNDRSYEPAISADGRFVAFESGATNLYPDNGDTAWDVFRRDVLGPLPEAAADAYATDEDTPLIVASPGVLGNDTDPDGDTLTAETVSGPAHGGLTLNGGGSLSYTPARNFYGSDSFTYRTSDGNLDSRPVTVTIDVRPVNDAPVATTNTYATDEDAPLSVDLPGVLGNDSDPDGDPLKAWIGALDHGRFMFSTLEMDGSFIYLPEPDFNGRASFSYQASDGKLSSDPVAVTINVRPVNDAPAAADDAYATDEDTPLQVAAAAGVLSNDSDVDGDDLSAAVASGPAHGSLELNAEDGSLSYTPNPDYHGSDSFSYRARDGGLESDPVTVTIEVRPVDDPPPADPAQPPSGDSAAAPPAGAAAPRQPAIARLRLAPRCARPSRSGRVRIRMSLRMARPAPLQIRVDRAVGGGVTRNCPSPNQRRRFSGSFQRVATLDEPAARPAATAASVTRRLTLRPRLSPGLYRISVRAKLDRNRLSAPRRRYLRVLA
jgi:Bacterial Ig domain/WD40-like Beta Propeller Repeat